jgi:translocation and assembly module TamA
VFISLLAGAGVAAEPNAAIVGNVDKALRQEIERAVGVAKRKPDSAFEARRRARDAAQDAASLLRSEGYYEASVEPDVAEGAAPRAMVRIALGPRFRFRDPIVGWVGAPPDAVRAAAATRAMALKTGAPGRAADVLAAEGRIVAALRKSGHADAAAAPREVVVDHADQTVRPAFKIAAGPLVRLDGVELITRGRTRASWVRGLAAWKPGSVYDPDKIALLEQRLTDVGVYESVVVSLAPEGQSVDGSRPVVVDLADRKPRTLELGAGYSTIGALEQGAGAATVGAIEPGASAEAVAGSGADAKWTHYNLLGRADSLILTGRLYDIQQKAALELDLPDWGRPDQTLKVGVGVLADHTDAYDDLDGGVGAIVVRRFTKTTSVSLGGAFDYDATREKDAVNPLATPVGENLKLLITTGLAAFTLDRSNDPLDPTRGWRIDARAEPTWITGDRDLVYLKAETQMSGYVPLDAEAETVLAARVRMGSILGGEIPDVPADRRFYAGGGGSVRGYSYQAVGPRLSDNTPAGGLSLVESSFEVRRRLNARWGLVAFVDTGSVGGAEAPQFRGFSTGVGVGVRYNLGFGPFRLDLATPLNPRQGDGPIQVYLSIGQSF